MAAKYQLITELYRRTGVSVAKSPQAWQSFLSSACRNYKCRFDEQLLIYAQRPDAVAVAELGTWNKLFKRWVNKDSKGIAVFDPKGRRNTLKYYFDISDTHEGYYGSRPVPIWQMDERYEQAVKETIDTNTYGKSSGRSGNYSTNYQISGRELLTPDEVRMLDNRYALLFIRGERPVMDLKYDILKHPNLKLTTDGGMPPYLHGEPTQAVATLVFDSDIPKNAVTVQAVSTSYELLSEEDLEELFKI